MTNLYDLMMNNINGNTIISLNTTTDQKLAGGKKNPFNGITKKITEGANVMVFQNKTVNGYDAMVKRRLMKEGKNPNSFKLSERKWGSRIPNTPFIEHKGEYYLEVIFLNSGKTHYEVDGVPTSKDKIQGFPVQKSVSGGQGGLNDQVIIRTYKVSSIDSITINHETHDNLTFDI